MKVLVVGGAGYVGRIVLPALSAEHDCRIFDRAKVPAAEDRSIAGDVNDEQAIRAAVAGMDAVIYMPLGRSANGDVYDVDAAFDTNVKAMYRWLRFSLDAGVRGFVQASSLSVYDKLLGPGRFDERTPVDSWDAYGLSKSLAEQICERAAMHHRNRTIVVLRLMLPTDAAKWTELRNRARTAPPRRKRFRLGPRDTARLFLAAVNCSTPGVHVVQAAGDPTGEKFPIDKAAELLGWRPQME